MNTATHETNGKARTRTPEAGVEIALIDPSPSQPRRTFDEAKLRELADDIKVHGVLQDVLLRPSPKKLGRYELVFGERRFRASKLAGLSTIPAKVRELTDAQVLEIQIVENAKRADIHPLEEADAYEALHKKHGYAVEEIAAKVAKSTASIYARLKLCALVPEARKAFVEGKIDAAKALLIARIPHEDLQRKALAEIARPVGFSDELPSLREAQKIVREKFMLRLANAAFDRTDAKLVAGTPACSACPKRTGNQRELFSDVEDKDDLCTDPKCFKAKSDADWARRTEEAKAKGLAVLPDKKAKETFDYRGEVSYSAPFIDLGGKTWVDGKERSNRSIVAKADLPITLARDADGRVHELVDQKAFERLKKGAAQGAAAKAKPTAAEKRWQEEQEAARKQREREAKKRAAELADIVAKAERRQPNDAFWRTLALEIARSFDWDIVDVLERRELIAKEPDGAGEDLEKAFRDAVAKMKGGQARGVVVELLMNTGFRADDARAAFRALYGAKKSGAKR